MWMLDIYRIRRVCQLNDEQINEIRDLRKYGWKQKELADRVNVTQSHISRILSNKVRMDDLL